MAPETLTQAQLRLDRRRLWWWLPVGGLAMVGIVKTWQAVAGEPPQALFMTLDVLWIAATFGQIARRTKSRCPRCGHRWLRAFPWMSLRSVHCHACGHAMPER